MAQQRFFEDVEVGNQIPSLAKCPSTQQLVMWAGASGDYYQIHYDKDFAQKTGLSGVIVHGRLKVAFLMQMLRNWVGERGAIRKIGMQHRGMDFPGDEITCGGVVTKKYEHNGEHYLDCDVWTENPRQEKTVIGSATVTLPLRSAG